MRLGVHTAWQTGMRGIARHGGPTHPSRVDSWDPSCVRSSILPFGSRNSSEWDMTVVGDPTRRSTRTRTARVQIKSRGCPQAKRGSPCVRVGGRERAGGAGTTGVWVRGAELSQPGNRPKLRPTEHCMRGTVSPQVVGGVHRCVQPQPYGCDGTGQGGGVGGKACRGLRLYCQGRYMRPASRSEVPELFVTLTDSSVVTATLQSRPATALAVCQCLPLVVLEALRPSGGSAGAV